MNKPIVHDPLKALLVASKARENDLPATDRRAADAEMARVLRTTPSRMASDPSSGGIAHWKHDPLHDVVEPMTDHVIMTYPTARAAPGAARRDDRLRLERFVPGL